MPRSFALGEHYEALIDEQLRSGRYADENEVVRDALRLLAEQDELQGYDVAALRAMAEAGRASGRSREDGDAFLDRMEARFRAAVA